MPQPRSWNAIPPSDDTISGFVTSCLAMPRGVSRAAPCRAKTSTHRMLTVGTIAALQIAASAMPFGPNSPAASVTPT